MGYKEAEAEVNFMEKQSKGELGLKKKYKLSKLNERYKKKGGEKGENCDWGTEAKDTWKKC